MYVLFVLHCYELGKHPTPLLVWLNLKQSVVYDASNGSIRLGGHKIYSWFGGFMYSMGSLLWFRFGSINQWFGGIIYVLYTVDDTTIGLVNQVQRG